MDAQQEGVFTPREVARCSQLGLHAPDTSFLSGAGPQTQERLEGSHVCQSGQGPEHFPPQPSEAPQLLKKQSGVQGAQALQSAVNSVQVSPGAQSVCP